MKTILLIESNPAFLENLVEGFEMEGYKIIATNSGNKAIRYARKFIPNLVVSSVIIDKMSGYDVLRLLLNTHKTSRIPFIFSTTRSEKKDITLAMESGADDYIVKPYELDSLFIMASTWIKSGSHKDFKHDPICPRIADVGVHA